MEYQTEFNLKENISIWKSELSKKANMTQDNINELESHLRDEIDALVDLGLSSEESLLLAKKRIGKVEDLTKEFAKVNQEVYFRNKIIPYVKGMLIFIAVMTIIPLLTNFTLLLASSTSIPKDNFFFISIGSLLLLSLLLIPIFKKFKVANSSLRKFTSIPVLVCIILVGKLFYFINTFYLTKLMAIADFGSFQMHLNMYKLIFLFFMLLASSVLYYKTRKTNKLNLAE